jgi:hypothetical protein
MAEAMHETDLVDKALVKAWAWWALVWLTFFPLVGILVSIQFHNPEFLGGMPWFTFGRLRPVHTNGVIFGSFTTAFIALLYYFIPRLCGVPLYRVECGWWLLWMWNAFLILGSGSLLLGYVIGVENAEFEWPLNLLRYLVLLCLTIQVLGTIFRRRAARFYVSFWYTLAAAIWTLLNLLIGNAGFDRIPVPIPATHPFHRFRHRPCSPDRVRRHDPMGGRRALLVMERRRLRRVMSHASTSQYMWRSMIARASLNADPMRRPPHEHSSAAISGNLGARQGGESVRSGRRLPQWHYGFHPQK